MRKPDARDVIRVYPTAPKSASQLSAARQNIKVAQAARRRAVGGAQQRAGLGLGLFTRPAQKQQAQKQQVQKKQQTQQKQQKQQTQQGGFWW
jgi:hypothetical protein